MANSNFNTKLQCGDRVLFKEEFADRAEFGVIIERFERRETSYQHEHLEYYIRPDNQEWAADQDSSWEESDDEGRSVHLLSINSLSDSETVTFWGTAGIKAPVSEQLLADRPQKEEPAPAMPPNPKKLYGAQKPDLSLIPPVAQLHQAMAFENGASKYGAYNWRDMPVEAMTYIAAAKRHIDLFLDGQDYSSDANVHNLGHVMACCAILLDSQELGVLLDNRPKPGASEAVQNRLKAQKAAALEAKKS